MRATVEPFAEAISLRALVSLRWQDIPVQSGSVLILSCRLSQSQQALLLVYELAAIEDIVPYHNIRLSPMPAVEMTACVRALEAACPRGAGVC